MVKESIERLRYLCDTLPAKLDKIPDDEFSKKTGPEKWSKKEILGHLIDSAANNHHRFVRAQFDDNPLVTYDQNQWNHSGHYADMEKSHLIKFWALYNRHLVELAKRIPVDLLNRKISIDPDKSVPLEFVINDYLVHLEHHLHQLVDY